MNLDTLHDDLIAAINQLYLMDERFPHSNYRVQLVNRLGGVVKEIKRRKRMTQIIVSNPEPKPRPYLPWDD